MISSRPQCSLERICIIHGDSTATINLTGPLQAELMRKTNLAPYLIQLMSTASCALNIVSVLGVPEVVSPAGNVMRYCNGAMVKT